MILPSKAYSKWEKQGREALLWQKWPDIPLTCSVRVNAHFYYKGNKPDLAGAMESISDCLQGIVWADDGQIVSWDGSRTHHDLKNPRTEVSIWWDTCHDEAEK